MSSPSSSGSSLEKKECIEVVSPPDPSLFKNILWLLACITAFTTATSLILYFSFRVYCALYLQKALKTPSLALAWFFIAIELFTIMPNFFIFICRMATFRRSNRPVLRAVLDDLPSVDVFITCCNENNDTILNTVRAAASSDYPQDRLRVIICDDGHSSELEVAIEAAKYNQPNLHYTTREGNADFKAGNLNHSLEFTATLGKGPSAFVAGLDADMIPDRQWLRSMIAHFLIDPNMGMTCPPQHFYNVPINDPLRQDLDFDYRMINKVHDALGTADCIGSGYLVRREALRLIGGFPTFSVAEDTATSSMIVSTGWKVISVDEHLQCGEMPDSMLGHIKQRTRWNLGNVQTAMHLRFRLHRTLCKALCLRQRLAGFVIGTGAIGNGLLIISFVGLPLALLSGYPFIVYDTAWQLSWLLRLACIFVLSNVLHQGFMACFAGYRAGMRYDQAEMWLVPYYFTSILRSFILPARLGGTSVGFKSTGSVVSPLHERDPSRRARFLHRARVFLLNYNILFHVAFIVLCLLGVTLNVVRCFDYPARLKNAYGTVPHMSGHDKWIYLLTRIGWPPVYWIGTVWSCMTPVTYMCCPPDERGEDELIDFDLKSGARYPKEEERDPRHTRFGTLADHWSVIGGGYAVLCLAASWYV